MSAFELEEIYWDYIEETGRYITREEFMELWGNESA